MSAPPRTLTELFFDAVHTYGAHPAAFRHKVADAWRDVSHQEAAARVQALCDAFPLPSAYRPTTAVAASDITRPAGLPAAGSSTSACCCRISPASAELAGTGSE